MKKVRPKIIIALLATIFLAISISFGPLKSLAISNVLTAPATEITDVSAKFTGSADPDGKTTFGYFRYAALPNPPIFCNDLYGSNMRSTSDKNLGSGANPVTFSKKVSGLFPNTTYYFCAIASDQTQNIKAYGGVQEFTTKLCSTCAQVSIQTGAATAVDSESAYLNGFYNANIETKTWFEYRKMTRPLQFAFLWSAPLQVENHEADSSGPIKFLLTGLNSSNAYEFRAVIEDRDPNSQNYLKKIFGDILVLRLDSDIEVVSGEVADGTGYTGTTGYSWGIASDGTSGGGAGAGTAGSGTSTAGGGTSGSGSAFSGTGTIGGGIFGSSSGGTPSSFGGAGGIAPAPTVGSTAMPLSDAIVRFHEGVETVFARQIMNYPDFAKHYGYQAGMDLQNFAGELAHTFAQIFGYYSGGRREIRVSYPDIAAYEFGLKDGRLAVYEYYANKLTGIAVFTTALKNAYGYEYYFTKR